MSVTASITAVGGYLPDYILTNQELETMVDTSNEWILERTGISERRILKGEGLGSGYMGAKAVEDLLRKRNLDPMEIDMLICCTVTKDMVFPATANIISDQVGAKNAWGFDLEAACSGFLFGLSVGTQFIQTGRYKKVVVVGTDKMSSIIDYQDRNTCIIFGDGAGAVLLEPDTTGHGVLDFVNYADGDGAKHLHMKAGGSRRPPSVETVMAREHFVYQEGKAVFKRAIPGMTQAGQELLQRNHLSADDVTWVVPHQANVRIIEGAVQNLGIPMERVMMNIHRYGNTTDGTLPLCLWDYEKQLRRGDNLLLVSFGGGFTWGGAYIKWAYNGA
jgi:3-oxoacyl-[acyl-carrier-protein] synthase-3